jgi:hypothetical protein
MKSEKTEMPRLFQLWKEITGEDLWNEDGPDSQNRGVPNTNKKD